MLGEPVALVIASDRSTASDAVDRVVVDYEPDPRRDSRRGRARARCPAAARRRAREPRLHDRAQDRGLRRRLRCRAGQDPPDDRQPAADAGRDRDARGARRLERRGRRADALQLDADPSLPAHVRRGDLRHPRGPLPRDRTRRRRRLRLEAQLLRRGVRGRTGVQARRRAGQVDRGPLRGDGRDDPRARPAAARRACGRPRRTRPGAPHRAHPELRRVPAVPDAVDRAPDGLHGARRLRHPAGRHHLPRGLHEHDADRRVPRCRASRGDAHDRADDGSARRRARHRPGRDPAPQLHQGVPLHDCDGPQLRLGQLRGRARQGARDGRLRWLRGATRRGEGTRHAPRHRALDVGRDLRARPVRRHARDRRSDRVAGSRRSCGCTRPERPR